MNNQIQSTVEALQHQQKILFLTTSNRWSGQNDQPKSSLLAEKIKSLLPEKQITILDISKLNIVPCEGNVSTKDGNQCGLKEAFLEDTSKNPSGYHRCWASLNSPEDELWKVSKALFESDCVVFFASVRWGQLNSIYQKLIERLTWIENRVTTLQEESIVSNIKAGIITVNQNWRGIETLKTQKQVLKYFGFQVQEPLCWNWQFIQNSKNETSESYLKANQAFQENFQIKLK